jgi:hypothetical protein
MTDPEPYVSNLGRIADSLERIATALEQQARPRLILKADPPVTDKQAREVERKLAERLGGAVRRAVRRV